MIKIIHFTSRNGKGGLERQVSEITQNSKNINHIWVSLHYSKDNYVINDNLLYIISSNKLTKRIIEFNEIVNNFNPDVVVCWDVAPYIITLLSRGIKKYQIINASIRHGVFLKSKGGYLRMLVAHMSHYVLANSQAGLRVNKINKGILLYNGVNERFNREKYLKFESKKKSDNFIFVSVMNLLPYKDYFTIFKALKHLKNDGIKFKYYVIGEGQMRTYYDKYLISNDLSDNIILCGSVCNPEEYLAKADIFIHSSKGEGVSNAILEAMYMGLPIITTDTGGTLEILDGNAITFSYQDYQALYNALTTLINDEKLRKEMGEKSYLIVKNRFTVDHMIINYERIISAIINKNLCIISDLIYECRK